ncbi:MAG: hypothetical protein AAGD14_09835 [Planctomycetota bacterium]
MQDREHLEDEVYLTGWVHVEVRDEHGAPCADVEVTVLGCGFV